MIAAIILNIGTQSHKLQETFRDRRGAAMCGHLTSKAKEVTIPVILEYFVIDCLYALQEKTCLRRSGQKSPPAEFAWPWRLRMI